MIKIRKISLISMVFLLHSACGLASSTTCEPTELMLDAVSGTAGTYMIPACMSEPRWLSVFVEGENLDRNDVPEYSLAYVIKAYSDEQKGELFSGSISGKYGALGHEVDLSKLHRKGFFPGANYSISIGNFESDSNEVEYIVFTISDTTSSPTGHR